MRRAASYISLLLLAVLSCLEPTFAASCTWVRRDVDGPPARHSPGMAYDSRRQVVVLFGGTTGRERDAVLYGDTWEWDGVRWRLVAVTGPTPRIGHQMVYDAARGVVVLFGGNDGTFRNETWEWDGHEWRRVAETGPSPRSRFGMAYDEKRQVVVLFGGIPRDMNDTWEWDGQQWKRINTTDGPEGRSRMAMAYHPERQTVILFGGRLADGQPASDTWEWNGTEWRQLATLGDQARARHGMVYEPTLGTMLAHGVAFGGRAETLAWSGEQWVPLMDTVRVGRRQPVREVSPVPRVYYGMVYDAARGSTLLFGGWDGDGPLGDTWELRCE